MKSAALLMAALLVAAIAASSAADITTAVRGKCRQQMREQEEKLEHCQQYMRSSVRGYEDDDDNVVNSCGGCGGQGSNQECCARECCKALQRMDDECACQTVKALAERAVGLRGSRTAASRCGVTQQCDIRAVFA